MSREVPVTKSYWIAFLDLLFCTLFIVIMMVHPEQDQKLQPPGNLFVYTIWQDEGGDVDTWMLGPKMAFPIGYDNKDSDICNLVKDDQGILDEKLGVNYENIFCRQTPDGEYILNVHAFSVTDNAFPLTVNVQVAINVNGVMTVLFNENVILNSPKEEITVVRFKLKDGKLVPGSVFHTFISLYDMKKAH